MKKHLKIVFFALLMVSPEVFPQDPEKPVVEVATDVLGNVKDDFQEHFFEALKQKAIENHEKAINELVQCLALDPKPVVYLELGKNYNALKQYSQAAVYLEKGRKALPKNEALLEELYSTYYQSKDYERALPVVQDLAAIDPGFSEDLVNLYMLDEQYEKAIALLDSLDKKRGTSTYRESLRRQIYSRTNNVDAQIDDLQQSIAENPDAEKEYLNLIFVYSENGETEKAFETAKKLLEINPSSELVHLALYKFYITKEDPERAVQSMKVLLGSNRIDEVTKYQALNDFLMYVSENPEMEKDLIDLVNVFSKNEQNTKVFSQLGTFFLEKGKQNLALEYFEKALENTGGDFSLFRNVILLNVQLGNVQKVHEISVQALEIFPSQPWLYLMQGTALNKLGRHKEAEEPLLLGSDYIIDDAQMQKAFYEQLAETYKGLNLPEKESQYRQKAQKENK